MAGRLTLVFSLLVSLDVSSWASPARLQGLAGTAGLVRDEESDVLANPAAAAAVRGGRVYSGLSGERSKWEDWGGAFGSFTNRDSSFSVRLGALSEGPVRWGGEAAYSRTDATRWQPTSSSYSTVRGPAAGRLLVAWPSADGRTFTGFDLSLADDDRRLGDSLSALPARTHGVERVLRGGVVRASADASRRLGAVVRVRRRAVETLGDAVGRTIDDQESVTLLPELQVSGGSVLRGLLSAGHGAGMSDFNDGVSADDRTRLYTAGAGAVWEARSPAGTLFALQFLADYSALRRDSTLSGVAWREREGGRSAALTLGVEHALLPWLEVRGGAALARYAHTYDLQRSQGTRETVFDGPMADFAAGFSLVKGDVLRADLMFSGVVLDYYNNREDTPPTSFRRRTFDQSIGLDVTWRLGAAPAGRRKK